MEKARVNIGMNLIVDTESYTKVGAVMDRIDSAVRQALKDAGLERAMFDFTSFNTHPCKAIQMMGYDAPDVVEPARDGAPSLPLIG